MPGTQEFEKQQRLLHRLARYIVENDGGELDGDFCRTEMAAGRCHFVSAA